MTVLNVLPHKKNVYETIFSRSISSKQRIQDTGLFLQNSQLDAWTQ